MSERCRHDLLEDCPDCLRDEIGRLREQLVKEQDFRQWVDTWVSNPIGSYSVMALDGLFRMARAKIAALIDEQGNSK